MYPESSYEESVRDRVYGRATGSSEGRRSMVVVLLTVCVFLFLISLSCRQATAPGAARNVLESGLVTLTDLDQMIADEGPGLRDLAAASKDDTVTVPAYPLDIVLTPEEVTRSSDAELRALILDRSSALLYAEGIGAFDNTGDQSLRRFSIQGLLEFGVGQVSRSIYDRATLFAFVSLLGCAISGAIVAATASGWARMRQLGFAAAAGALPVVLMAWLLRVAVGQIGGDDPFIAGYRDITHAVLGVPLRNSVVVLALGVVVVAASVVLARLERMSSAAVPLADEDY